MCKDPKFEWCNKAGCEKRPECQAIYRKYRQEFRKRPVVISDKQKIAKAQIFEAVKNGNVDRRSLIKEFGKYSSDRFYGMALRKFRPSTMKKIPISRNNQIIADFKKHQ